MDKRDTTTATSRVRHGMSRRRLSPPRHPPPELPAIRSNFFLPDGSGFSGKCVLPSLFHIKVKKGKDSSEGREITTGGKSERICCIKTDEHGGRARERGVVFHPFLRRNFALSLPHCTPCGHCRLCVTRSRDWAVSQRFFKLSKRTHDS
jgi:hypothetical protein